MDNPIKHVKANIRLDFMLLDTDLFYSHYKRAWHSLGDRAGGVGTIVQASFPERIKDLYWTVLFKTNILACETDPLTTRTLDLIVMSLSLIVQRKDPHWELCHETLGSQFLLGWTNKVCRNCSICSLFLGSSLS